MSEFLPILQNAQPHPELTWLLDTNAVAEGFGVTPEAVRSHKSRRSDELVEGQHWIKQSQAHNSRTLWTKNGVIRLGMFLDGDRAKQFRDAAEAYLVGAAELQQPVLQNATVGEVEDALIDQVAEELAWEYLAARLPDAVGKRVESILRNPTEMDRARLRRLFTKAS